MTKLLISLLALMGFFCLTVLAKKRPVRHAQSKPNIIFILADDLGYGDLGCYGQPRIDTPSLDRMAAEGIRFTQAYAGYTVCAPSRSVLMTGQHWGNTRVKKNGSRGLFDEDITVAEILKEQGYATGLIGKWGIGEETTPGAPWLQGFDEFFGYLNQGHAHNFYPEFLWRNDKRYELANEVVPSSKYKGMSGVATVRLEYSHDLFAEDALRFIKDHKDGPFFLYLAFTIPHANNQAQLKADGKGDPGYKVIPERMPYHKERQGMEVPDAAQYQNKDWPGPQKGTAAMISRMDEDIGDIFKLLKREGLDNNTIVFFSSDNGPHKEGGNDPYFFKSMGPLKGYKRSFTDGGIRVPMIVRWPGIIAPGQVDEKLVWYFADFLPTAVELTGGKIPDGIDGVSVLPTLRGEKQDLSDRFLFWGASARRGQWKYVRRGKSSDWDLFNVEEDIGEEHNVAEQYPDIVKSFATFVAPFVPAVKARKPKKK